MRAEITTIPGCMHLRLDKREDTRGYFCKTYHDEVLRALGVPTTFREHYFSESRAGVVRGMHFQLPPHDHAKLVYCAAGSIHDVVLDLRRGSPTYGQTAVFELDGVAPSMVFIPRGCAHGFCARSDHALTFYLVETVYSPQHDSGIAWDSFGHEWPVTEPVLSERDRSFLPLGRFISPFVQA